VGSVYAYAVMKKLLLASAICSAVFLTFVIDPHLPGARFGVVFKVASIGLLAVMAAVAVSRKLLVLALAFSALGDLLLDVRRLGSLGPEQLFLFGLVSFLVAHLFYVLLFVKARSQAGISAARKIACVVVVAVATASLVVLWPGLKEMRIPVLAYSLVLTAMALTAQRSRFGTLVAVGALSFVASDTMLAMTVFGHPFAGSRVLVWITYYAAQAMIAIGVTSFSHQRQVVTAAAKELC
jgi:uncharacterized membrane protein YhhN